MTTSFHIDTQNRKPDPRRGQAIVEFIIALIAILALTAGLLQVAALGRAYSEGMTEARHEAAILASFDFGTGVETRFTPDYILNWDEGPDGRRYGADDVAQTDSPGRFIQDVVDPAAPDNAGWDILDLAPEDRLATLRDSALPTSVFGLVKGEATRTVDLLPAFRRLIYRADTVTLSCEVWMTRLKGVY